MKILLAARMLFPWEDGILIYNEMVKKGAYIDIVDADTPNKVLHKLSKANYDWVFITGSRTTPPEYYKYIKDNFKTKILLWDNDGIAYENRYEIWQSIIDYPDVIIHTAFFTSEEIKKKKKTKNVIWLPHFYDEFYYQTDNKRLDPKKEIYDVCFIGNAYGSQKRIDWCKAIKERYNAKFAGNIPSICEEYVFSKDMVDIYKQSKIVIDIKRDKAFYGEFETSDRLFRTLGSGAFLLTYEIPRIEELFGGNKIAQYNDTLEDLFEKLDYYLENGEERELIAKEVSDYTVTNHSLTKRAKEYLEIMESFD